MARSLSAVADQVAGAGPAAVGLMTTGLAEQVPIRALQVEEVEVVDQSKRFNREHRRDVGVVDL